MTKDEARDVVTSIVGPIDRPWDTRVAEALEWCDTTEMSRVQEAARTLGYDDTNPDTASSVASGQGDVARRG